MKKILLSILLGLTVCCSVGLFACDSASCNDEPTTPAHTHTEVTVDAVEATCSQTGLTQGKKCSTCNQVIVAQEIVAKKAHDATVDIPARQATCKTEGQTAGKKCSVCDEIVVHPEVVPKVAHAFIDDVDSQVTYEIVNELKHNIINPRICEVCGELDAIETEVEHIFTKAITTVATCAGAGEYTFTCNTCGYSYTEEYTDLDAHVWGPAAADGVESCQNCPQTRTVKVITSGEPIAKDTIGADTVLKLDELEMTLDQTMLDSLSGDINLSAGTVDKSTLTNLSDDKLDAIGDSPIYDFTLTTSEGNKSDFNGGKIKISIPYILEQGDDPDNIVIWYVKDDGEVANYNGIYSNGFVTFEAEHFSYYAVVRLTPEKYCSIFGHDLKNIGTPATCEKDGYDGKICIRCGYLPLTNGAVKALGHEYVKGTAVSATCEENGYTPNTCTRCNASYHTEIVNMLGHEYEATKVVNATCKDRGYTEYTCNRCQEVKKDNYVDKSGHNYVKGVCTVCKKEEQKKEYEYLNLLESIASDGITINMNGLKAIVDISSTEYEKYFEGKYQNKFIYNEKIEVLANKFAYTYKLDGENMLGQFEVDLSYNLTQTGTYESQEVFNVVAYGEVKNGVVSTYYNVVMDGVVENAYMQMSLDGAMSQQSGAAIKGVLAMIESVYDAVDMTTVSKLLSVIESGIDGTKQGVVNFIFKTFFTAGSVENGKKVYTLDWEKVIQLKENLLTLTVSELIDEYLGEGAFEQLVDDLKAFTGKTVGDLIKLLNEKGIKEQALIALINTVMAQIMPSEEGQPAFDITSMMPQIKAMKVEDVAQMLMSIIQQFPGLGEDNEAPGPDYYPDYDDEEFYPDYEENYPEYEGGLVETKPMNAVGEDDVLGGEGGMLAIMIDQYAPMLTQVTLLDLIGFRLDASMEEKIDSVLDFLKTANVSITVDVDGKGNESIDLKQIANDAVKSVIEKTFTIETQASGEKTYTFKKQIVKDIFEDVKTLTVTELIEKYIGTKQFESITTFVKDTFGFDVNSYVDAFEDSTLIEVVETFVGMSISSTVEMIEAVLDSEYSIVMKTSAENTLNSIKIQLPSTPITINLTEERNYDKEEELVNSELYTDTQITLRLYGSVEYVTSSEIFDSKIKDLDIAKLFSTDGVKEFKSDVDASYVKIKVENGAVVGGEALLPLNDWWYQGYGSQKYYGLAEFNMLMAQKGQAQNTYIISVTGSTGGENGCQIYMTEFVNGVEGELQLMDGYVVESYNLEDCIVNISTMKLLSGEDKAQACLHNYGYTRVNERVVTCKKGVPGDYADLLCDECGKIFKRNQFSQHTRVYDLYDLEKYHDVEIVEAGLMKANGDCEDGWYTIAKCKDCDNTYVLDGGFYHSLIAQEVIKDLSEYACGELKVVQSTCMCELNHQSKLVGECDFDYQGSKNITVEGQAESFYAEYYYKCALTDPLCTIAYAENSEYKVIDCKLFRIETTYVYTVQNDVHKLIYSYESLRSYERDAHDMQLVKDEVIENVENGTKTTTSEVCSGCGLTKENVITQTSMVENGLTVTVKKIENKTSKGGDIIQSTVTEQITKTDNTQETPAVQAWKYTCVTLAEGKQEQIVYETQLVSTSTGKQIKAVRSETDFYAECIVVLTGEDAYTENYNAYLTGMELYDFWESWWLGLYDDLNVTDYLCYYLDEDGSIYSYQQWKVEHDILNCMTTVYEKYDKDDEFEKRVNPHHYFDHHVVLVPGTCATAREYGWECETCGDITSKNYSINGHNYEYLDELGTYVCTTCGLESIAGADGRIVIEQAETVDGTYSYLYADKGINSGYYYLGEYYYVGASCEYEIYVMVIDTTSGEELMLSGVASVTPNSQYSGYKFGTISFDIQDVIEAAYQQYGIEMVDLSLYNVGISVNIQAQNDNWYLYQYVTTPQEA